jgi:hypothetical protein
MAFFKNILGGGNDSTSGEWEGTDRGIGFHSESVKRLKTGIKIFEMCIRHFEQTYIDMIKELEQKTYKLNLDTPFEESIVLKSNNQNNHNGSYMSNNQLFHN